MDFISIGPHMDKQNHRFFNKQKQTTDGQDLFLNPTKCGQNARYYANNGIIFYSGAVFEKLKVV